MTEAFLSPGILPRLAPLLSAAAFLVVACLAPSIACAGQAARPGTATTSAVAVDTGGPRWNELSAAQRKVLAPLTNDWNGLDSRSKERWLDVASRFHKLPAEEQQRANQRMADWSHMTVAQRTQARLNFQESRDVSKEERAARWQAYQALPEEKKRELARQRAAAAAPASAASTTAGLAKRHAPTPFEAVQPKTNVVGQVPPSKPVGVVAARPGATTTLMNRRATPPAHQRDGQPKIAGGPGYVDRTTLLPRKGPQATVSASASSPTTPRP